MLFSFTALVDQTDITSSLDVEALFAQVPTTWKRPGGTTGLLMTAASAAAVFTGIVRDIREITHVPDPNGLPGGYPVQVTTQGVKVVLPDGITFEQALQINEAGLLLDRIERIEADGTVQFSSKAMSVFKEVLGYECTRMPIAETEHWAREFLAKYTAVVNKYS